MEYPMKHYTYLWEYSPPDQEFPVSNYLPTLVAIFKSYQAKFYYFTVISIIKTDFTFRSNIIQLL